MLLIHFVLTQKYSKTHNYAKLISKYTAVPNIKRNNYFVVIQIFFFS